MSDLGRVGGLLSMAGLLGWAFGGSFNNVTAVMTCCAVFSIIGMALGPETKNNGLPH